MKIEALKSFSGTLSMHKGQIKEYKNGAVLNDLKRAGYVKEVKERRANSESKGTDS